jgi:hypothetical protein
MSDTGISSLRVPESINVSQLSLSVPEHSAELAPKAATDLTDRVLELSDEYVSLEVDIRQLGAESRPMWAPVHEKVLALHTVLENLRDDYQRDNHRMARLKMGLTTQASQGDGAPDNAENDEREHELIQAVPAAVAVFAAEIKKLETELGAQLSRL